MGSLEIRRQGSSLLRLVGVLGVLSLMMGCASVEESREEGKERPGFYEGISEVTEDCLGALPEGSDIRRAAVYGTVRDDQQYEKLYTQIDRELMVSFSASPRRTFQLMERSQLDAAIKESQYNQNQSLRSPEEIAQVGDFLPAEALISAAVMVAGDHLRVAVKIFSTESGRVLATRAIEIEPRSAMRTALGIAEEPEGASGASDAAAGEAEEKGVVLEWASPWFAQGVKAGAARELVEQFNRTHEGEYRIKPVVYGDYRDYEAYIEDQLARGEALPDIFLLKGGDSQQIQSQLRSGRLMDWMPRLDEGWKSQFRLGSLQAFITGGSLRLLPYEQAITPLWFNRELLQSAGFEEFPQDGEVFHQALEQLKAEGVRPFSQMTGGGNGWTSMLWYSHILGALGGPEVYQRPLTDPVFVRAAEYLKRYMTGGNTTDDALGAGPRLSAEHYMEGETAFFSNGPWFFPTMQEEAPRTADHTGMTSFPRIGEYPGGQVGFPLQFFAASAELNIRERDAAEAFLQWMCRPESVYRLVQETGQLFYVDYGERELPEEGLGYEMRRALGEAQFIVPPFVAQVNPEVRTNFGPLLERLVHDEITADEFCRRLAEHSQ